MLEPKTVSESQVVMCQSMLPTDANPHGNVHGGTIMKLVDAAAGVAATKHARSRTVTAHVDDMSFLSPVYIGNVVTLKASVNDVGKTSMEVGVRVEAEDLMTGEVRHVSSAYLVMVALDEKGHPRPVPPLLPENSVQERRMREARVRNEYRRRQKEAIHAGRKAWQTPEPELAHGDGVVEVVGHRGAMGHAPENTMASFADGLALGADWIELDVQLSRDGELVVIHDPTVDRTTNGSGFVKDLSLEELRQLDAGSWFGPRFAGAHIPTLAEVLDWARGRTRLIVEIKNGPIFYPGIAERVVACLREHNVVRETMVISFDHCVVRQVKSLEPAQRTGILYVARAVDPVLLASQSGAEVLMPLSSYVTEELIALAHAAGLSVSTWTVNEPEEMRRLISLGVDGIGTNYPDRLRALL